MQPKIGKHQNRVLGLLALLSIITYLDRVCIAVAGPRMQDDLHISPEAWGWVTGIFAISYGAFAIPIGALGDRFGPRRVLTGIVLWWSAFTSLTGPVSNYYLLLLARFCFGMGQVGAYPNIATVIVRWIPAGRAAGAWGIVWMASQIGGAISPLLVLPIQTHFGWRASFYIFGIPRKRNGEQRWPRCPGNPKPCRGERRSVAATYGAPWVSPPAMSMPCISSIPGSRLIWCEAAVSAKAN